MVSKTIFSKIYLLFLYVSIVQAQPAVFDITKYGAVADGKADTSQA